MSSGDFGENSHLACRARSNLESSRLQHAMISEWLSVHQPPEVLVRDWEVPRTVMNEKKLALFGPSRASAQSLAVVHSAVATAGNLAPRVRPEARPASRRAGKLTFPVKDDQGTERPSRSHRTPEHPRLAAPRVGLHEHAWRSTAWVNRYACRWLRPTSLASLQALHLHLGRGRRGGEAVHWGVHARSALR